MSDGISDGNAPSPWLGVDKFATRDKEPQRERLAALSYIQRELFAWATKNFGEQQPYQMLLGVMEELGELCHAQLKGEQRIRGTPEALEAKAKDAVGDVLIYLMQYCSTRGWDIGPILNDTVVEVLKRDWKKDPVKGGGALSLAQKKRRERKA